MGKEAAQVQKLYLHDCIPLGKNNVLKSESQHFYTFCNSVYHICKISDVALQYPPRTETQRYRDKEAVQ